MLPTTTLPTGFAGALRHAALLAVLASSASAQGAAPSRSPVRSFTTGPARGFGYLERSPGPCLSVQQRSEIHAHVTVARRALLGRGLLGGPPQADVRFRWPLAATPSAAAFDVHGVSNFVDHDPASPDQLLDFECGTRSYDLASGYDHDGTDFFTWPFGWSWMDQDAVHVVAVAAGVVISRSDGNFDESCGFGGGTWNAVYVEHDDGTVAWYGHLKDGSLTPKAVGERVQIGEYLGVVGSSGNSTGPHLHLEVYDPVGNRIDPFQGPCNPSPGRATWLDQRRYYDSGINRMMIGEAPVEFPACPGRTVSHEVSTLAPGDTAYFTTFYRDQLPGQVSQFRVRMPSGALFRSWNHSSPNPFYAASYWWRSYILPTDAELGTWRFEADYQGRSYVQLFSVGVAPPERGE